jgi:hypothetical protein
VGRGRDLGSVRRVGRAGLELGRCGSGAIRGTGRNAKRIRTAGRAAGRDTSLDRRLATDWRRPGACGARTEGWADSSENGTLTSPTTGGSGGIGAGTAVESPTLAQSHAEPESAIAATATFAPTAIQTRRRAITGVSGR